ncbi:hypothetical protein H0H92_004815 [Tricholoma furcatifolium]|nr:hypothetical protein H0H92_004815 [Tricholoma furcatifolium]
MQVKQRANIVQHWLFSLKFTECTLSIKAWINLTVGSSDYCFEQLRGEILNLLNNETVYSDKIRQLEEDLTVWKRAYNDVNTERLQLEKSKQDAAKEKEDLENQIKASLLDGDGVIFSPDLIAQGRTGGHAAAQKLTDSILHHLSSNFGANQYQLWVYIFFNKRGLVDAFGRAGNLIAKTRFDDFMMGFNQAAERFVMVDVGDGKEAADAKIKARLEDELRLPQTFKIVFGGCHDNGYVMSLRSQITAGLKQKLILLRSYTEMAAGIVDLELPVLTIPELFVEKKLVIPMQPMQHALIGPAMPSKPSHIGSVESSTSLPSSVVLSGLQGSCGASTPEPIPVVANPLRRSSLPSSYSSAVQMTQKRIPTPDLDFSDSTPSEASDDSFEPTSTFRGSRHVNPNINGTNFIYDQPLSKHKPPPCTLFYLANCKHGADCKYSHDYLLEEEHFKEIRLNAKKAPCPAINKGWLDMILLRIDKVLTRSQESSVYGETIAVMDITVRYLRNVISSNRDAANL